MNPVKRFEVSSLTEIGGGGMVVVGSYSYDPPQKEWLRRPWRTRAIWNVLQQRWVLRVAPGFVNGLDPACRGYELFQENPDLQELDLIDEPLLPVFGMRNLRAGDEKIPPFFEAKGVRKDAENVRVDATTGQITVDETPRFQKLPPRGLWAVDCWVAVARPAMSIDLTPVDPSGFSGQIVDYSVRWDASYLDRVGPRARLVLGERFTPPRVPDALDRLLGNYVDEGEDRLPISTVYFLSPPGEEDAAPGPEWRPYVKHHCFYNLNHAPRAIPPPRPLPPVRFFSGIGAGLGDLIINQSLSLTNELRDRVLAAVRSDENAGKFWTV